MQKLITQFLPRFGLASYLCCLQLHSFLTTKRHPSDVESSYISIFRLIQSAVYPVGVSKDCFCFTQMIDYNSKNLVRILTKIDIDNCLWTPYKCTKFQLNWWMSLRVTAIFSSVQKDEEKTWKFAHSYLGNTLRDFLQIWCAVSLGRWAPIQQLWCSSDKRSWSYECVKIATLLFLLVYSRRCVCPVFLGCTTHYHVSWFYGSSRKSNSLEQLCSLKQRQNNLKDAVVLYNECTKQQNI